MAENGKELRNCQHCNKEVDNISMCHSGHEFCGNCYYKMWDIEKGEFVCLLCISDEDPSTRRSHSQMIYAKAIRNFESVNRWAMELEVSPSDDETSGLGRSYFSSRASSEADIRKAVNIHRSDSLQRGRSTTHNSMSSIQSFLCMEELMFELETEHEVITIEKLPQMQRGRISPGFICTRSNETNRSEKATNRQLNISASSSLSRIDNSAPNAPVTEQLLTCATTTLTEPLPLDYNYENPTSEPDLSTNALPRQERGSRFPTEQPQNSTFIRHYSQPNDFQFQPTVIGSQGSGQSQFDGPSNIKLAPRSELLIVADAQNDRVLLYDFNKQYVDKFGSTGGRQGQFFKPWTLGILTSDTSEEIIVANGDNKEFGKGRVQILEMNGDYVKEIGQGHLVEPTGISCRNNLIAICDCSYIKLFKRSQMMQAAPLWKISIPDQCLWGLLILDDDTILATDSKEMIVIRRTGRFAQDADTSSTEDDADIDNQDEVPTASPVAEDNHNTSNIPLLEILGSPPSREGREILGSPPSREGRRSSRVSVNSSGEIGIPRGIAVDRNGYILVVLNNKITVLKQGMEEGTYTYSSSIPLPNKSKMTNIHDVCVLPDGSLVICGFHGIIYYEIEAIQKFTKSTQTKE